MSTVFAFLVLFGFVSVTSQDGCLINPPELEWDSDHKATLEFGSAEVTIGGLDITFTTRLHGQENGIYGYTLPSPTIRVQAGQQYELSLKNRLRNSDYDPENGINNLDITNIHTHGAHISGQSPGDNIFNVAYGVNPDSTGEPVPLVYEWRFPCDHASGTMWYHPHVHGSVAVQVGGGAMGALIIENENEFNHHHNFPRWYRDLTVDEMILVIQHINLAEVKKLLRTAGVTRTDVFQSESDSAFYVVNGEYQPLVCMDAYKYRKLRIVFGDILNPKTVLTFPKECEVWLLSKDGVLVHGNNNQVPRRLNADNPEIILSLATRADIAVGCATAGDYAVTKQGETIFFLSVAESTISEFENLDAFTPIRPDYLESLMEAPVDDTYSLHMGPIKINGEVFQGDHHYLKRIFAGEVEEWKVTGQNAHPFHIHVNHMQLIGLNSETEWVQNGDWIDTLIDRARVRFRAERFGGRMVLHCHVLEHEDKGAMAMVEIIGGCKGNDADDYTCDEVGNANEDCPCSGGGYIDAACADIHTIAQCEECTHPW